MADDTMPDVAGLLRARDGVDPGYIARLFQIESGGNPNAVTGSNRGLGQFGPREEAQYGITTANRSDPAIQSAAVTREAADHAAVLRKALGRDPTPGEQYLTHQQGIAGGPALLNADQSMPAWQAIRPFYKSDAMARLAITGNVPGGHPLQGIDADKITAGDFRNLWVNKFERGLPSAANTPAAATAVSAAMPTGVAPMPIMGSPQTGATPMAPENGGNDELLRVLQTLSASQQQPMPPPPPQAINYPVPAAVAKARALAMAMRSRPLVRGQIS